ncbi:MAG: SAM-dependent methyltransferase [Paracoccaceae bacterium]|nr:SAM-dependent methyltransferase [Paracoccaceae bacterium]
MGLYVPLVMFDPPLLTDRKALDLHRQRAAGRPAWFLHEEAASELHQRLGEINKSFTAPLFIGPGASPMASVLPSVPIVGDDPRLEVTEQAHDLVLHAFGLHWAEDPVGQLVQSRLALKPDGLFLGVMFGGATLQELRASLADAETRVSGGISPRVLPMADIRDLGGLLQRAGFALPVADSLKLTVRYPDLATLVRDLRGMGETNALAQRHRRYPGKRLFHETEATYKRAFSDDGYLPATFEVVFLTGWAPDASQPRPLRPGSAQSRLSDALGVTETPLKRD